MKFLFCGGRNYKNIEKILEVMIELKNSFGDFVVIEGEANGADSISREVANELSLVVEKYPAAWNKYGKAAGQIRNREMLISGKPDGVLAFHDDLNSSKGTKNMVDISRKANIPVYVSQSSAVTDFITEVLRKKA